MFMAFLFLPEWRLQCWMKLLLPYSSSLRFSFFCYFYCNMARGRLQVPHEEFLLILQVTKKFRYDIIIAPPDEVAITVEIPTFMRYTFPFFGDTFPFFGDTLPQKVGYIALKMKAIFERFLLQISCADVEEEAINGIKCTKNRPEKIFFEKN